MPLKLLIVLAVISTLIAALGLTGGIRFLPDVRWSSTAIMETPDRFCYLLFPTSDHVAVKMPNSDVVGILDRATVTGHDEFVSDCCTIHLTAGSGRVDLSELTALPPADVSRFIAGLQSQFDDWGDGPWRSVALTRSGEDIVLKLTNDRHGWDEFTYSVSPDGQPRAELWRSKRYIDVVTETILNAGAAFVGILLVCVSLLLILIKRLRAVQTGCPPAQA